MTPALALEKSAPTSDLYEERVFLVTLIQTGCHSDLNLCETLPYQMWFRSAPPAALSAAIPPPLAPPPNTKRLSKTFLSKLVTYFVNRWRRKSGSHFCKANISLSVSCSSTNVFNHWVSMPLEASPVSIQLWNILHVLNIPSDEAIPVNHTSVSTYQPHTSGIISTIYSEYMTLGHTQ